MNIEQRLKLINKVARSMVNIHLPGIITSQQTMIDKIWAIGILSDHTLSEEELSKEVHRVMKQYPELTRIHPELLSQLVMKQYPELTTSKYKNKMNRINRKSGFTLIELLIVLFIVGIMIFGAVGGLSAKSDGKRVGVITKFTYKGVFVKSYEGELNMGGVRNRTDRDGLVANVWEFSCSNPTVAKQIDDLLGKEVVIKYHQSFPGMSRSTSYDVVGVEEVKK